MRFLVDAQLPPDLATWLRERGFPADHVFSLLSPAAEDDVIWATAKSLDAVLLTKDEDFITLRNRVPSGPSVVWLRIGNATNPVLLDWLALRLNSIISEIEAGTAVIEVR